MIKIKLVLLFFVVTLISTHAQVGINTLTPDTTSVLDIQSTNKGILIPRMSSEQKKNINTPALGLIVYDTDLKCISQNIGTPTSPLWVCLADRSTQSRSFYMPSIAIDVSEMAQGRTINLYDKYKEQFEKPTVHSDKSPQSIPYFISPNQLYYYVTSYDDTVLEITGLDENGKLMYNIIKESDYNSFMNVVFVVK